MSRRSRKKITNLMHARLYLRYILVFWTEFTKKHTRLADALRLVCDELDRQDGVVKYDT